MGRIFKSKSSDFLAAIINFMKIKIPQIKKGFKKGSSAVNPNIYWDLMLFLTLGMIIFAFTFGLFVFRKVETGAMPPSDENGAGAEASPRERINKILEYFSTREQKSREIINSPSPIIDPSL